MTLTVDKQLWSAATMVLRRYGDDAPRHVAERIGQLATAGDVQGVEAWQLIAARIDQLTRAGEPQ